MLRTEIDVFRTLSGHWPSRLIYVAVKTGVVDALASGALAAEELARRAGVMEAPLRRVLGPLVALGVLAEPESGVFGLTEVGRSLCKGTRARLGSLALLTWEEMGRAWDALPAALRTGETSFEIAHGRSSFEHYRDHPDRGRLFGEAMVGLASFLHGGIMSEYDFSPYRCVVDVGGGHGQLLASILAANPAARGVLFDRPAVVELAGDLLGKAGVIDRCERIGGDFFESVPAGGDLYVLSNVLHNWGDAEATQILESCRRAMAPEGRILVVEMVLSEEYELELAREADLNMMVLFGGRERTAAELDALFAQARLRRIGLRPVQPMTCLVEAARCEEV